MVEMNVSREGNSQGDYKKKKNWMLGEERHYRPNTCYSNSAARMSDRVNALSSCNNRPMAKGNAGSPLFNIKPLLL